MAGTQRVSLTAGALLLGGLLALPSIGEAGCHRARRHRCCGNYSTYNTGCCQTAAYQAPITQCCGTNGYTTQPTMSYGNNAAVPSNPSTTSAPPPPVEGTPAPAPQ